MAWGREGSALSGEEGCGEGKGECMAWGGGVRAWPGEEG